MIRQVTRQLAKDAAASNDADDADLPPDLFTQVQAEAEATWRSPATAAGPPGARQRSTARLARRLLVAVHAGVVVPTTIARPSSGCAATARGRVCPRPTGVDR